MNFANFWSGWVIHGQWVGQQKPEVPLAPVHGIHLPWVKDVRIQRTGSWGGAFWSLTKGEGGAKGQAPGDQEKKLSLFPDSPKP